MAIEVPGRRTGSLTAAIVDGYSSATFLPAAFQSRGIEVVHVQSSADLRPVMIPPDLTEYVANIICPGPDAVPATIERLAKYRPIAVLAGMEPGVVLADLLSERLGLATNGSALSAARRNKYEMIETLRAAGIRCANQFKSDDPAELAAWAERTGSYPVVVKPLASSSSDNVRVCLRPDQVAAAGRRVLASRDMFGEPNSEALVQSFLAGTEYCVDTISAAGDVFVCGIWKYEKKLIEGGRRIYDRDVLCAPADGIAGTVIAYLEEVLRALGICHGPAHAEIVTTASGPVLVEIGARVNGAMLPRFHQACTGVNPAGLVALAYAQPAEFRARFGGRRYEQLREAAIYEIPTELNGVVDTVDQEIVAEISALETIHSVVVRLKPGMAIRPTVDLTSSVLRIFAVGPDQERLARDRAVAQALAGRVYQLA